jgi:hypothetical protein
MLHVVITRQAGLTRILEVLHFPVTAGRLPGFGELPITFIASVVSTVRPPDDVIIESTEISGSDTFEEVINLDELVKRRDPFRERLIELVKQHGNDLLPPEPEAPPA